MKIRFNIEYHTQWGEDLRVRLVKVTAAGEKKPVKECPLETFNGRQWEGEITFSATGVSRIEYLYAMYRNDELVWTEWEVAPHTIILDGVTTTYYASDFWRPIPEELPLFSSAFTECVGTKEDKEDVKAGLDTLYASTLQMRVVEPRLRKGQFLAVCGSTPQFGQWNEPKRMHLVGLQEWAVNFDAALLYNEVEYKFVIVNEKNEIQQWEEGSNRYLRSPQLQNKQIWIKTELAPRFQLPNWKVAGVVIPVFSLRTEKSYGVGDFGDLKAMIGWAVKTHMHAIQILPINDTMTVGSWKDSYPYNSISIYAFHPLYCW